MVKIDEIENDMTPVGFCEEVDIVEPDRHENVKIILNSDGPVDEIFGGEYDLKKIRNIIAGSYSNMMKTLKSYGIKISTITLDCKLRIKVNMHAFAKYVELDLDTIVSVEYGPRSDKKTNRSIVPIKKKNNNKNTFLNQVTIRIKPLSGPDDKYINIKIFRNGSLQITGCIDIDDFYYVSIIIMKKLSDGVVVKSKGVKKKIRFVPKGTSILLNEYALKNIGLCKKSGFKKINQIDKIGSTYIAINSPKIRLINSDFKIGYKIDRKRLADILQKRHGKDSIDKYIGYIDCNYSPSGGHSGVHIRHYNNDTNITHIFVFQTGSVIMTGAKNLPQIINAYHYIMNILNYYYHEIKIVELDPIAVDAVINLYLKKKKQLTYSRNFSMQK